MDSIRIEYSGPPPFKAGPGPKGTRTRARERKASFTEAAQHALERWRAEHSTSGGGFSHPWDPLTAKIALAMTYKRVAGESDAANIIGGVCDALQRIFYADDRQVARITYTEERARGENEDRLMVEVSGLVMGS